MLILRLDKTQKLMPQEKYLKVKLDAIELDIDTNADFPLTFDYQLEDVSNFQSKKSSESLGIKLPATLNNQQILNTFHNTGIIDNTPSQYYKGIRKFTAEANGVEIFVGKAIPKRAVSKNGKPISYELNAFGNNGDWLIDLKDVTLYDILKKITFIFTKENVVNSWFFDGRNENLPYVFAPIKYAGYMDPDDGNFDPNFSINNRTGSDNNYSIKTMKPSLSKYFIIYWAFKALGYKIKSNLFDTDYYRRQILPWTWGNFLTSEGTKYDIHKFLAKSDTDKRFDGNMEDFVDLNVIVDPSLPLLKGTFNNNNTVAFPADYTYDSANKSMKWTYNTPHYGILEATFSLQLSFNYKIDFQARIAMDIHWYKNGVEVLSQQIFDHKAPIFGSTGGSEIVTFYFKTEIFSDSTHEDVIECKISQFISVNSNFTPHTTVARNILNVLQFQIDYFRIPIGGTVSFDSYLNLQKFKFLDFLKGESDLFNLGFQTDPVNKEVLIEPAHSYKVGANIIPGYFNGNTIDWTNKEDISTESVLEIFDDSSRELVFKFKDDSSDGTLKLVQDRYKIILAASKYVFDKRFKAEKNVIENRFYSPTMHYLVDNFKNITGKSPQMICMVPENISNTSASEAENTFNPKTAYYKGLVTGVGGWKFDGTVMTSYPFAFAVNYNDGGQNDPILSYCDEKIGSNIIGTGLLKKFYWQRLVIMNNGQWLTTNINLENIDITNWYHRERINIDGQLFEIIGIKGYNPLSDKSTQVIMRKWVPITIKEDQVTFPSNTSILTNAIKVITVPFVADENAIEIVFDTQYNQLLCLFNDIPKGL